MEIVDLWWRWTSSRLLVEVRRGWGMWLLLRWEKPYCVEEGMNSGG
jgi:hypothetical protein